MHDYVTRIKGALRRSGFLDRTGMKAFLRDVSGIIHVGANAGQERNLYAQYGLNVLWIEPLEDVFEALCSNLAGFPKQRAIRGLITDVDDLEYAFHVASNAGASSSILELGLHKAVWPDVTYTRTAMMKSKTLVSLLRESAIDASAYDALVMDTQGSELLVLKGAAALLDGFKYVQTEVADFEAYKGCCQLDDIESYLAQFAFKERARKTIAQHPDGGRYYEIVYRRYSPLSGRNR